MLTAWLLLNQSAMRDEIRYAREVEKLAQFTSSWNGGASLTISTLNTLSGTKGNKSQTNEKTKDAAKMNKVVKPKTAAKAKVKPARSKTSIGPIEIKTPRFSTSNGSQLDQKTIISTEPAPCDIVNQVDQSTQDCLSTFQSTNQLASTSHASIQQLVDNLNFQYYMGNTGSAWNQPIFNTGFHYCANAVAAGTSARTGFDNIFQAQIQNQVPVQIMPFSNCQLQASLNQTYQTAPCVQAVLPFQSVQGIQGMQGVQGTQFIHDFQAIQGLQSGQGIQAAQTIPEIQSMQDIQGVQDFHGIQGGQDVQNFDGSQALQLGQGVENSQPGLPFQNFQIGYNSFFDYSSMLLTAPGQTIQTFQPSSQTQAIPQITPIPKGQTVSLVQSASHVQAVSSAQSTPFVTDSQFSQLIDTKSSGESLQNTNKDQAGKSKTILGHHQDQASSQNFSAGQEADTPDLVSPESRTQIIEPADGGSGGKPGSEAGLLSIFDILFSDMNPNHGEVSKQSQTSSPCLLADKNYTLDGQLVPSQEIDLNEDLDDVTESIPRYTGCEKPKREQVEPNDWEKMQYDLLKELDVDMMSWFNQE